jgi:uncharacterized protein (UPF0332 family)
MYRDLLEQAEVLATLDKGKPKQANLRRAVSSAYYALFHYLVDQSCQAMIGAQHAQRGYRHALARAYVHGTMNDACRSFSGTQLPAVIVKPLPRDAAGEFRIPMEVQVIAATFNELQQKRHLADYDLSEWFKRSEVLAIIEQVETVIAQFDGAPPSDCRQFFLACLLAWRSLTGR